MKGRGNRGRVEAAEIVRGPIVVRDVDLVVVAVHPPQAEVVIAALLVDQVIALKLAAEKLVSLVVNIVNSAGLMLEAGTLGHNTLNAQNKKVRRALVVSTQKQVQIIQSLQGHIKKLILRRWQRKRAWEKRCRDLLKNYLASNFMASLFL